jgi:hypothetical protein
LVYSLWLKANEKASRPEKVTRFVLFDLSNQNAAKFHRLLRLEN